MALFNDDNFRIFNPVFASEVGLNLAIVCQQVYGWCEVSRKANQNDHCFADDNGILRWWTYNTFAEWQTKDFPWWSISTLKRIFTDGRDKGVILSTPIFDNGAVVSMWWAVDREKCHQITASAKWQGWCQNDTGVMSNWHGGGVKMTPGSYQNDTVTNKSLNNPKMFNTFGDLLKGGSE